MKLIDVIQRMSMGRAVLIGFVVAGFYYLIMYDSGRNQEAAIAASRDQVTELRRQMDENQAKLDRAIVYKRTVAELGTEIQKLLSVIPEQFGIQDLMKIVSNEAKVAGSSLNSIVPGKQVEFVLVKEFDEVNVTIELTGSFLQHMLFLSNLTKISQILIVRKMDITSSSTGASRADEANNVKLAAEIVAYRYKGSTAAAAKPPGSGVAQ